MSLVQSLEKLVDIFEYRGVPMRQHLRPGLSRAGIQASLSPLGIVPPEELYELYEWHDGVNDADTFKMFFAEQQFLPLHEAIKEYHEILKYYGDTTSLNLAKCFPFAHFMGDYCLIYCEATLLEGLQYPIINIFTWSGIGVIYENIDQMTQTVTEWFVSGVYDSHPVDDDLRFAIRKRLNPRIDYDSQTSTL